MATHIPPTTVSIPKPVSPRYPNQQSKGRNTLKRSRKSGVPDIFPDTVLVDLHYGDYFSLTSTTGSLGSYFFNATSCYDPNNTGTGHQPAGFDQYMALYESYVVEGATFTVQASTASAEPIRVSLTASKEYVTVPAGMEFLTEWPQTKIAVATSAVPATLSMAALTHEFFQVPRASLTALDAAVGNASANPASMWYFRVYAQTDDYSSSGTVNCLVKLTQRVRFFKRKLIAPS